jgi:penicillin-binding protein 2
LADSKKTSDINWFKLRLTGAMFCVMAAFAILIARLFYLQVIERNEFSRLAENNCIRLQSINPPRGMIFDRNGRLLVENRPSFDLNIILKDAKPFTQTMERLSSYVRVEPDALLSRIDRKNGFSPYKPVLLKQDIGRDALASIEVNKFDLPGVEVNVKPIRHYIRRGSSAHIIGYLSEINPDELKSDAYPDARSGDFVGKFGAEKSFDRYLRGKRGGRQVEVNATGQVVRILKTVDAQPGHNIYLTIDQRLQETTEALLSGIAGSVVAIEPATGEILAMVSSPSFDQNAFVGGLSRSQWSALISNPFRPMENKAIQGEYPPASTYKIITAIAGLEEGVIDDTTTFFCPGFLRFGDRVFRCWKKGGHGTVDIYRALEESCDVFFYQVGQKLGVDRLAWHAKASGLGAATGINLDHEGDGLIPTAAWKKRRTGISWQRGETMSVAIGQGYDLVTPLQMAVLTAAVANDGVSYKPLIVRKIETADGKMVFENKQQIERKLPASKETLAIVKRALWRVVNGKRGTARVAKLKGIEIIGKTGTAQVVGRRKNEISRNIERPAHLKAHAWFVAFAPADDPQIAVSVMVEHGEHGSSAASPIAREIIKSHLTRNEPSKRLRVVSEEQILISNAKFRASNKPYD